MSVTLADVRLPEILRWARLQNASDVHLAAGRRAVYRIDGTLQEQSGFELGADELVHLTQTLLNSNERDVLKRKGDITVSLSDPELGTFRIHAYRTGCSANLAIRLLAQQIPLWSELKLPHVVTSFVERHSGLVLVTGPTGSGKSTVLAALLDRINRTSARHIITIEDPIEYVHRSDRSLISQRAVPLDVPDFASAVYGALRSDPDVLLIGELRDSVTIQAALTAAETGHLVLATLHTSDAPQTVDRVISAFEAQAQQQIRSQLAQTLSGVVCLRLIPRTTGGGRVAAAEVLCVNEAVRTLIRDGKTHHLRNVLTTGRQCGMQTLESHLSELIYQNEITYDAARSATDRPGDLQSAQFPAS